MINQLINRDVAMVRKRCAVKRPGVGHGQQEIGWRIILACLVKGLSAIGAHLLDVVDRVDSSVLDLARVDECLLASTSNNQLNSLQARLSRFPAPIMVM